MKHLVTITCLVGAIIADLVGWAQGIAGFIIAGMFLEGVFWLRLLRRNKQPSAADYS